MNKCQTCGHETPDDFDKAMDALEGAVKRAAATFFHQAPDFDPIGASWGRGHVRHRAPAEWDKKQSRDIADAREVVRAVGKRFFAAPRAEGAE